MAVSYRSVGKDIRKEISIAMTKELIEKGVKRYAEEVRKTFGSKLYKVILYGSCARGDFDDESDVDIMIILDVPKEEIPQERSKTFDISYALDDEFEYELLFTAVVESKEIFSRFQNVMPFFMNVIKEGIVL